MPGKKQRSSKKRDNINDTEQREEDIQPVRVKVATDLEEDAADQEVKDVEQETLEAEDAQADAAPDDEIAKLIREKEEQHDRLLRVQADFDNYRKRVQKEQANLLRYGSETALREILPIIDNIELAVDSARSHKNSDSQLREGIEMILNQFFTALEKLGVRPIETVEHQFDPNKHDALLRVYAPEAEENEVIQEIRKGYYLHDKVLRPAQVTVGTRERAHASESTSQGAEETPNESGNVK
jgi:molecular chaperone GrpE